MTWDPRANASPYLMLTALLSIGGLTWTAFADQPVTRVVEVDPGSRLLRTATGNHKAPTSTAAIGTHGGTMVIDRRGLLVIERSAGALVRVDAEGNKRGVLSLSPGLGQIVHDGEGVIFVADRGADRVVQIDATQDQPSIAAQRKLPEPHGLALTPDGQTLLVTSVNEHALIALDTTTMSERWRVELAPEPRAVAVSADGSQAAVGFLSSGSIALVSLTSDGPKVRWRSIEPRDHVETIRDDDEGCYDMVSSKLSEARSRFAVPVETGRRYARNVYALMFAGDDTLVAPHQLATPQLQRVVVEDSEDSYGGLAVTIPPLLHRVALVRGSGELESSANYLEIDVHQPRALAYELGTDTLYVGGYGDDRVVAVADATQKLPHVAWLADLGQGCGVDGLAVEAPDRGGGLWVHCEFRRQVLRLDVGDPSTVADDQWLTSEVLAEPARAPQVERGAELFRRSDRRISGGGLMACASCHPEGRSDGLTWRLGASILQVPVLAGRVDGTGPYKWDGQDATLHDSLRHTMERLGGSPDKLSPEELDAMVAYVASLAPPKPPTQVDAGADLTRGRAVFEAAACDACHSGDKLTDRNQHELDTTLDHVDTPSLVGLAHSRPYFHDGSANDLRTLLTDRGTVHDMADTSELSDAQLRDLIAYLESL